MGLERTKCGAPDGRAVLIALTGTPGTGKSAVGEVLEARGYTVLDLDALARERGAIVGRSEVDGAEEVDLERLSEGIHLGAKVAFLRGHFAHLLDANVAIVLRCRPAVLRRRLEDRGWPPGKVRENVEAEALDVVTQEAVARLAWVWEVDTSDVRPEEAAAQVLAILQGKTDGHEPGRIDWSREVLAWS